MNCSGKHAAMLATCVANGWDTATYLRRPTTRSQVAIAETFAELTGEPVEVVAVDGCGAPLLSDLADRAGPRVPARWPRATDGPERRVADAIRAHPEFTSGTRRDEAALLRAVPGADRQGRRRVLLRRRRCADGRAVALKTDDGAAAGAPGADGGGAASGSA